MRLATFIFENLERILAEWEAFARTIVPMDAMDIAGLRDHAGEMLRVIARDLETPQSRQEGVDKAQGRADADGSGPETPAQAHGAGRAESGFTVEQMLSEYRAMRASVIRLWADAKGRLDGSDVSDLIRFDEAIDQALAESTARFAEDLDQTRETFLGILGHDLRTPLAAMITSAQFMLEVGGLPTPADTLAERIVLSGKRMNRMVDDLLDFTMGRLAAIPVDRKALDLQSILDDAVGEVRASIPDLSIETRTDGDLRGTWDGARLSQVLTNLLANAVSHGKPGGRIRLTARGEEAVVTFAVHNEGPPIPRAQLERLFDPMKPGSSRAPDHLGLGLYIVDRIVDAHGGSIDVESTEAEGTTFSVTLPRRPDPAPVRHAAGAV